MRPLTNFAHHSILAAALVAFAATGAAAAVDAFLKLGDIKGEAKVEGFKDQIEIDSFAWGQAKLQPGGGGGAAAGAKVSMQDLQVDPNSQGLAVSDPGAPGPKTTAKRQHKPLTISKPLDKGSMTFRGVVAGCATGKHYDEATLTTRYYKYEFQDVIITSCAMPSASGSGGDQVPMESISFNYGKIVTKYATDADKAKWDIGKNKKP